MQERLDCLSMPLKERRCRRRRFVGRRGTLGASNQQIGDTGERRGDDDERPVVRCDQRGRAVDGGGICERRAAEFPDFECGSR
jgi:hypothetical protein